MTSYLAVHKQLEEVTATTEINVQSFECAATTADSVVSSSSSAVQDGEPASTERAFLAPISPDDVESFMSSRFPKRTVDHSTWAVTLFGEWRAHRNRQCLEGAANCAVYIDRYKAYMDKLFALKRHLKMYIYEHITFRITCYISPES